MKICITAKEAGLEAPFDEHFGRAPYLIIVDGRTGELVESINNSGNQGIVQGAGLETGRVVSEAGVSIVLTGHLGPKATDYLKMAEIASYKVSAGTVAEAFEKFKAGDVVNLDTADVRGHWQ